MKNRKSYRLAVEIERNHRFLFLFYLVIVFIFCNRQVTRFAG